MINEEDCQRLEGLIRAGRVQLARAELERLNLSQIPRPLCAKVAELCRRAMLFNHSIRLLGRFVRAERALDTIASPLEAAEYAFALIKIGAISEGREILLTLDPHAVPTAPYYLALSRFPEWDYEPTIEPLETFLQLCDDPYQALTAKVNLVSANLQVGAFDKAGEMLAAGRRETGERGYNLLHANFLELSAQFHFHKRQFDLAVEALEASSRVLSETGLWDELFVRKWLTLVECYRHPADLMKTETLRDVQARAVQLSHWETIRDLDFHLVKLRQDGDLYRHLHHGTPCPAFRSKLTSVFRSASAAGDTYDWVIKGGAPQRVFEVDSSRIDGKTTNLKTGQLPHKLLMELTKDFYKPVRIAALAAKLFEGQYYDPAMMPNRVHQLVVRLRKWLANEDLGLGIEEVGGAYRLVGISPVIVRVTRVGSAEPRAKVDTTMRLRLEKLQAACQGQEFTVKQAAERLSCSVSTALRVVNAGIDSGVLQCSPVAAIKSYKFKSAG